MSRAILYVFLGMFSTQWAYANTVVCTSSDNTVKAAIAFGPGGEPPPGIEVQKMGFFDNSVFHQPVLKVFGMQNRNGAISGWSHSATFNVAGKEMTFVLTLVTASRNGSADTASWYFKSGGVEEFTALECK